MSNFNIQFENFFLKTFKRPIRKFSLIKKYFINKYGLEVGGPSKIFRDKKFLPIYSIIDKVDGCNFSESTIWEGNLEQGEDYNYYKNKNGIQYVSEATDLSLIPDSKYDFIISSNCLEHIANPLKALGEWIRVTKKDGIVLLVLPNKDFCFDHNRSVTEFSHLLDDLKNNTKEDDLTHLDEILKLHDLKRDKRSGDLDQFKVRSLNNYENRALHQHIFDLDLMKEIYRYFGLEILITHAGREFIIVGRRK